MFVETAYIKHGLVLKTNHTFKYISRTFFKLKLHVLLKLYFVYCFRLLKCK